MKKNKTFVTMLAAIAAMLLLPGVFKLKASAAEPDTYYIHYESDKGGWYVHTAADEADCSYTDPKVMQFFYNNVKDGDVVVITCSEDGAPQLDLGTARLSNVTILPSASDISDAHFIMLQSAGIADLYVLAKNICSISAPVVNAYVYDPAIVNFNYNVKDILLSVDHWKSESSMGGIGTVESLKVLFTGNNTSYTLYNFKKGTFYFENGTIQTSWDNFSAVPATSAFQLSINTTTAVPRLKDVFDERYYADRYPDLKAAFGYNREALWAHYITSGVREGRSMNSLLNVTSYRAQYLDLSVAFGDNWDAYLAHYLTLGAIEGRNSGTEFQAMEYANWYEDLKKTYGNNVLALWQHYKAIGVEWSRQP